MIIVTGRYFTAAGQPCTGEVTFALSAPAGSQQDSLFVMPPPVTAEIGTVSPGCISVELACNDSLSFLPPGSFYTVTERIDQWASRSYPVTLLQAMGISKDLSELIGLS